MRVLELYHDCGPGGAEQMILDLCRRVRAAGHAVTVVTCREGWLAQHLREEEIETHVVPLRRRFDLHTLSEVLRIARERAVDVFHAHELPAMMGLAPAALLRGFPVVATLHGREHLAARGRRRLICRLAARCSRRVVAVSRALERFLVEDVGVPRNKVETIYNGIDVHRFDDDTSGVSVRDELGIPANARVVGTVGSLYPVKGQAHLLRALASVVREFPGTVCLLVGRGELRSVLQREAADQGLGGRVRFLGYRTDVPRLLSIMDVFVLPSLSEGLPLALVEAQAAGKPAVATHVGGNPEVIDDGRTGYLVPPGRSDILADRISGLLRDPGKARAMGDLGRSRARQRFSLDSMSGAYLSLYASCLNGGPRPHQTAIPATAREDWTPRA